MNILIVEDNKEQAIVIQSTINKTFPTYKTFIYTTYNDALTALESFLFDIFILDIDLGEGSSKNGISIAKRIRVINKYISSPILFITSIPSEISTAINDIHCYSYLLKPYSESALIKSITSLQQTTKLPPQMIEVRDPNGIYFHLNIMDIVYIEIYNHRLSIYTKSTILETNSFTITSFCNQTNNSIIQCHKSYAINPQEALTYSSSYVTVLVNNKSISIPIGRKFKESVFKVLSHE